MNTALAEEGRRPSDNYDIIRTDLSVIYLGAVKTCQMTLLKEYYSVAMLICWYTMSSDCLRYYV